MGSATCCSAWTPASASEGSHSRAIADIVERAWLGANPTSRSCGDTSVAIRYRRPPGAMPSPRAGLPKISAPTQQRAAVALAATLADELINADALLLAVPLFNFGVSQHFKTWVDLVITDPRMGPGQQPLADKPAELVTVRGGNYSAGTPREGWDHSTPWIRRILEDVWGLQPLGRRTRLHPGRRQPRARSIQRRRRQTAYPSRGARRSAWFSTRTVSARARLSEGGHPPRWLALDNGYEP